MAVLNFSAINPFSGLIFQVLISISPHYGSRILGIANLPINYGEQRLPFLFRVKINYKSFIVTPARCLCRRRNKLASRLYRTQPSEGLWHGGERGGHAQGHAQCGAHALAPHTATHMPCVGGPRGVPHVPTADTHSPGHALADTST